MNLVSSVHGKLRIPQGVSGRRGRWANGHHTASACGPRRCKTDWIIFITASGRARPQHLPTPPLPGDHCWQKWQLPTENAVAVGTAGPARPPPGLHWNMFPGFVTGGFCEPSPRLASIHFTWHRARRRGVGIPWRLRGARLDAQRGGPRGSLCGFQSMASLLNEERGGRHRLPLSPPRWWSSKHSRAGASPGTGETPPSTAKEACAMAATSAVGRTGDLRLPACLPASLTAPASRRSCSRLGVR